MEPDLPPGHVNLEDDGPPSVPAVVSPAVVPEPAPDPDGAVDVSGQPMVPLAALQAERRQRQEFASRAQMADQLAAENAQLRPKADFFDANRTLFERPAPTAPLQPSVDPDALEAAKLMDFYAADGTPDVARGGQWLALQDRRAQRQTSAAMQPVLAQTAQDQSAVNYQRALRVRDADGRTPSEQSVRAVWSAMPAEYTADPRVAGVLAATALGLDRMAGPSAPGPAGPPLVTEPSGGTPRARPALSELEQRIAKDRGKTPTQWSEHQSNFTPGRATVLEE